MINAAEMKKLVKENPIVVYSIAVALVVFVTYFIIFAPVLKKLGVKYAECRICESQLSDARSTIDYAANLDKSIGTRILISEKEASAGIEELTRFGKSMGIDFSEIKPGDAKMGPDGSYKVMLVEINMEATGDQFLKFMGSVDELKRAIVRMSSFDVRPDKDDRSRLIINMVVEMYLSPGA
jgi:Tfp pilus assembly protein PilO